MSTNNNTSNRAPYPTRSRRRQQQEQAETATSSSTALDDDEQQANVDASMAGTAGDGNNDAALQNMMDGTNSGTAGNTATLSSTTTPNNPQSSTTTPTSGYRMGLGLVQARISPMAGSNKVNNNNNKTAFFPSTNRLSTGSAISAKESSGGGEKASKNGAASTASQAANQQEHIQAPIEILDGINVTQLRGLVKSCLGQNGNNNTSTTPNAAAPSSNSAVFFASILHSKTKLMEDAFLYASALYSHNQHKRCVQWIESAGLLDGCAGAGAGGGVDSMNNMNDGSDDDGNNPSSSSSSLASLQLESILLCASSLSILQDWNAVLLLLEDVGLYNLTSGSGVENTLIDDDDDIAWQSLKESMDAVLKMDNSTATSSSMHPLARICSLRGTAYSELGHPLRAAIYWKKALTMDSKCMDALEGLVLRNAVAPNVALDIIMGLVFCSDNGKESGDVANTTSNANNMEWLRALYLARVHVAAPTSSQLPESSAAAEALVTSMSMEQASNSQDGNENENQSSGNNRNSTESFATANTSTHVWPQGQPSAVDLLTGQPFTPIAPSGNSSVMNQSGNSSLFFSGGNRGQQGTTSNEGEEVQQPSAIYTSKHSAGSGKSNNNSNQASAEQALTKLVKTYKLSNSPEVLAMAAQQAFGQYQWLPTLKYCQALSPTHMEGKAAFCYVSSLVQLRQKRSLFRLAHEWVEASPKEARSWFAVGAYYYACQRYHVAQRHFCRATRLDPQCAEAWIAFGASFAACDESDQALASFRAAQRIAPGHHVSLLYIGMEYLRTNHLVLAEHFLLASHESCHGTDALAMSELGVLNMNQKKYDHAIAWFLQALGANADVLRESERHHPKSLLDVEALESLVENVQDEYWEPTLFNLAHAYRKERFFDHAVVCLERCIALKESSSAYSALGYCLHLQAMTKPVGPAHKQETNLLLQQAIDTYHQALSKKPDAAFCSEMLAKALGNALEMTNFFVDDHYGAGGNAGAGSAATGVGLSNMSSSDILKQSNSSGFFSPPKPAAASSGGGASANRSSGMGSIDQSSMEDGLSLSLESNSDVDMS